VTTKDGEPVLEEVPAPQTGEYHLLHIGGTRENGAHKGFGLGLMNEIMCNELSGIGPGPLLGHPGGHFFAAYDIEAFTDREKFLDDMDTLLKAAVAIPPDKSHDRVVYPGVLEAEEVEKRTKNGIPYHREVVEWFNGHLAEIGEEMRLP
jgi:LDH2 family malate/lactate/ureidoglycolate dehydrogenase